MKPGDLVIGKRPTVYVCDECGRAAERWALIEHGTTRTGAACPWRPAGRPAVAAVVLAAKTFPQVGRGVPGWGGK